MRSLLYLTGGTPSPFPTEPEQKEHRIIEARIKKKYERLRRRHLEVRGKRVDWIDHSLEEGRLFITVRFMDRTAFHLQFKPQIVIRWNRTK